MHTIVGFDGLMHTRWISNVLYFYLEYATVIWKYGILFAMIEFRILMHIAIANFGLLLCLYPAKTYWN